MLQELFKKLPLAFYTAMGSSFLISLLIVVTKDWHKSISNDAINSIQKLHQHPTPRIGGLAVFLASICAYFLEKNERSLILGPLILAGSFAFVFGLAEDVTKKVSITLRLIATILAGVIGWAITGVSLTHIGVPILDPLFQNLVFSVVFTTLAIGGISNSINIIDGLNGLASSMMVIALTAIAAIAHSIGDINLSIATLTVGAAIFGFFLVNWPWGKLFMGDGGSYFSGFALAWSCVLLVERNNSISPFVGLLVCIYPFTEVVFSILRRRYKNHSYTGADKQHLHSLIYRRYILKGSLGVWNNSIVGLMIGLLSIPPAICAYFFCQSNLLSFISVVYFMAAYLVLYRRIVRFKW